MISPWFRRQVLTAVTEFGSPCTASVIAEDLKVAYVPVSIAMRHLHAEGHLECVGPDTYRPAPGATE